MKNTLKSIRNKLHGDIHSAMNASRADIKSDLTEIKESLSTTAKKITPPHPYHSHALLLTRSSLHYPFIISTICKSHPFVASSH